MAGMRAAPLPAYSPLQINVSLGASTYTRPRTSQRDISYKKSRTIPRGTVQLLLVISSVASIQSKTTT